MEPSTQLPERGTGFTVCGARDLTPRWSAADPCSFDGDACRTRRATELARAAGDGVCTHRDDRLEGVLTRGADALLAS